MSATSRTLPTSQTDLSTRSISTDSATSTPQSLTSVAKTSSPGLTTPTAASASADAPQHQHIDGGQIAGIVVGCVVAIIVLVLIYFCCIRRSRTDRGRNVADDGRSAASSPRRIQRMASVAQPRRPQPDPYINASNRQNESFVTSSQNMLSPYGTGVPDHNTSVSPRPQGLQYPPVSNPYGIPPIPPNLSNRGR